MTPDALIARVARRQEGLVTRAQVVAAGLRPKAMRHRLATGPRWEPFRHGVYLIAGTPPSARQAVLGVCLAAGSDVAASHRTAGSLWGLELPTSDDIEIVGRRVVLEGVRSHQSETLAPEDLAWLGPIALTSPARTIVDTSGDVAPAKLGRTVDDALRRGLVTVESLTRCHERVDTGPGRRPTVALRDVLSNRRTPGDSVREARLVAVLARAGLPAPVLGHQVTVEGHRYRIDLSWPGALVGLEYDSWEFHNSYSSFHGDRERLRRLTTAGWTLLLATARTPDRELTEDLHRLLATNGPSRGVSSHVSRAG